MRSHNLEMINGRYVAYDAAGLAFRVTNENKLGSKGYSARPSYAAKDGDKRYFWALTLRELATKVGASNC